MGNKVVWQQKAGDPASLTREEGEKKEKKILRETYTHVDAHM